MTILRRLQYACRDDRRRKWSIEYNLVKFVALRSFILDGNLEIPLKNVAVRSGGADFLQFAKMEAP